MKETDARLERLFPMIAWREPLPLRVEGSMGRWLACRLCVATQGFKHEDADKLPQTREEFDQHLRDAHGIAPRDLTHG